MDKQTLKLQKSIVKDFWKNVDTIPVFINNTNSTHIRCREKSREIFSEICILFEPKILNTNCIETLFVSTIEITGQIMDIDPTLGLLYFGYVPDMLKYFKDECEYNELFETAANIKKFLDQYNQIQNINIDETED